ncbi:hypothetical protein GCM10010112_07350 [Actinoplanes lobatus]|uniref:Uncharacterized protein n=1 Tax=Actinoplanes lobatus TaxID=113568 RepID=A0A7W7HAR6_9ACTN|nr:hypothetical protein [Actinoplanes lobatus]MBB4747155.1 hypothetical protein [Actinoplanes lobatus]GGN55977.1 hypothetical protein GCM10010112_07350 [Actinoplanes lobatus]GIE39277.1 hypothetical protein Alo02nite_21750 [Actinoplanes lobatus]
MPEPQRAIEESLSWRNRRIRAANLPYPPGVLEACEQFDRDHSAWSASWMPENTGKGWERPAGFGARRTDGERLRGCDDFRPGLDDNVPRTPWAFGATIADLERRVAEFEALIAMEADLTRRLTPRIGGIR